MQTAVTAAISQAAVSAPTTLGIGTTTKKSDGATSIPDRGTLGKDDFLKLLLVQLRSQDPMKPMDDQQFTTQLTQFQTIKKLEDIETGIKALLDVQQLTQASGLIGKVVEGLSNDGQKVSGVVTEVSIVDGVAVLKVGDKELDLHKVTHVSEASK